MSLFADGMIIYTENSIDSTKKLLDLISKLGQAAGYKVNIQKMKAFLYSNNEMSETEIRKKETIYYSKKKLKYLVINLTNKVKNVYLENYTMLKKDIKEDSNKWNIYCVHGLEEIT